MSHLLDLERDLAEWLRADAAAVTAPADLRRRVLKLPSAAPEQPGWLSRFWPLLVAPLAATTAIAGVLAAVLFMGLFDAPPGSDGEPCNRRQTQRALNELRDARGYRFLVRSQTSDLDRERMISLDDPAWAWVDATVRDGAYLAPDRFVMRSQDGGGGFEPLERLQIGDRHWEQLTIDGAHIWVDREQWPTANVAWGHIESALPSAMIPAVSTLGFAESDADFSNDLPGSGGCIAVAELPHEPMPSMEGVEVIVPEVLMQPRFLALRVDTANGHPSSILIGPAGSIERQGLARTILELNWEMPDPAEFLAPEASVSDPRASATPPPPPEPMVIGDDAWTAETLPADRSVAEVSTMATGNGRIIALGDQHEPGDTTARGAAWITDDGRTWSLVTPAGWEHRHPLTVAWDGEEYLAVVYASDPAPGAYEHPVAEVWRSTGGERWSLAATLPSGAQPEGLVAASSGWVITGSTATNELQMRPAIWSSPDGERWTEATLDGTRSGRLGRGIVTDDGELTVTGCESPDDPDGPQSGSGACYSRVWRSDDGLAWESGLIAPIEMRSLVAVAGGLLAIGSDPGASHSAEPWEQAAGLWRSADGVEWTPVPLRTDGAWPERLMRSGDGFVALGSRISYTESGGVPVAYAWRSADGKTWVPIELGLPDDAIGSSLAGAYETRAGLTFIGSVQLTGETSAPAVWRDP